MGDCFSLNGRHNDVNAQRIGYCIKYITRLYGSGHIYGMAKSELIVFLNVLIRVTCLQQQVVIHPETFFENVISIIRANARYNLERLGQPFDRTESVTPPLRMRHLLVSYTFHHLSTCTVHVRVCRCGQ